jgi:hypothetical protein
VRAEAILENLGLAVAERPVRRAGVVQDDEHVLGPDAAGGEVVGDPAVQRLLLLVGSALVQVDCFVEILYPEAARSMRLWVSTRR